MDTALYCWGNNDGGQITLPANMSDPDAILVGVACGDGHTCEQLCCSAMHAMPPPARPSAMTPPP